MIRIHDGGGGGSGDSIHFDHILFIPAVVVFGGNSAGGVQSLYLGNRGLDFILVVAMIM